MLLPSYTSTQVQRGNYLLLPADAVDKAIPVVDFAGWELCEEGYSIHRKSFHRHAIEFIASGQWNLKTEEGEWQLTSGSVFTYGPGVQYTLQGKSKKGLSKYFVDFQSPENGELPSGISELSRRPTIVHEHRWLKDLFDHMLDLRDFPIGRRRLMAGMALNLMLTRLSEELKRDHIQSAASHSYERCKAYLDEHYLKVKNLSQVAQACGVAPAYLSRLFARFNDESAKAYLTRMKLDHATKLMLRNHVPLKSAAAEVGFEDVFHFSRVFKKCFGISPSTYLKKIKDNS